MLLTIGKGLLGAILGLLIGVGLTFLSVELVFNLLRLNTAQGNLIGAFTIYLWFLALVGATLGLVMAYLPWRTNLLILAPVVVLVGIILYSDRYRYIDRPPLVQQVGNFEQLTYIDATIPAYGLRYGGELITIEEQADFLGDKREAYDRFDHLITVTVPASMTAPVFVITVGDQYHDFFYLVREAAGKAQVTRLSNNTAATAQWLDAPLGDPTQPSNLLLDRSSSVAGRWLLLGDNCVLDVQTLQAYSFDTESFTGNTKVRLTGPALAFSPGAQSFVRLAERENGKYSQAGVPHTDATLAVFDFRTNRFDLLPVDRAQMRYHRLSEIDGAWLAYYFAWQKNGQGHDQLMPRPDIAPLPYQSHVDPARLSFESPRYYLGPVKPAMLATLVTFLEEEFAAVVDPQEESAADSDSIILKIGEQRIHLTYQEDSLPPGELWFSVEMDSESGVLDAIAQRFDAVLKTGIYDDLFLPEDKEP